MAYKQISKIIWSFPFLLLFSMFQQGVCFEDDSRTLERNKNNFTPLKDTSNTFSSKRGLDVLEEDRGGFPEDGSLSKRWRQKVQKVTLKGTFELDGFIENFDHSFKEVFLTLQNIRNNELLRLLAFLKDKQLVLRGLKFESSVSKGMNFSFVDEKGVIDFARFVTDNKNFFSSFRVFEMSGYSIHYKELEPLCRAFSSLENLRTFCVDDVEDDESEAVRNIPFEEGLKSLLVGCKNLKKLILASALPLDSIDHIAEYFSRSSLTWLDLSANFLDGESARKLLETLRGKKDLTLILRENNILPQDVTALEKEDWGFEIDFEDQDIRNPDLDLK